MFAWIFDECRGDCTAAERNHVVEATRRRRRILICRILFYVKRLRAASYIQSSAVRQVFFQSRYTGGVPMPAAVIVPLGVSSHTIAWILLGYGN
jgi:hypothetical protein